MNQVGELVRRATRSCSAWPAAMVASRVASTQRLSQITTDLQRPRSCALAPQPMEIIWNRFPRTVRDLALELNKQVDLVMEVRTPSSIDRSWAAIRDPLTHLVRNAIDHGIEPESERVAAGKNRSADCRWGLARGRTGEHRGGSMMVAASASLA